MFASEALPKAVWKAPGDPKEDSWGCLCLQNRIKNHYIFLVNFHCFPKGSWGGPRHPAELTPPPSNRVLRHFWSEIVKRLWVFAHFRKRRFWHPVYLSFSLVFFLSITDAETRHIF